MKTIIRWMLRHIIVLAALWFFVGIPMMVAAAAYMEAKTYNKLTGANATTWDALWVELRVQGEPKEGK